MAGHGMARLGTAGLGEAWQGQAWQGQARQGKARELSFSKKEHHSPPKDLVCGKVGRTLKLPS
jgi:hypothetical protein